MDPISIGAAILGLGVQFVKAYEEFRAAALQASISTPEQWTEWDAKRDAMLKGDEWKTDAQAGA